MYCTGSPAHCFEFVHLYGRFLLWAYRVTKASLQRAEEEALDKDTGREHSSSNCERLQYLDFLV
jgi:hypothetical protein